MVNTGRTMLVALSAALVLPCLTSTASADPIPPTEMTLKVREFSGTGCPPGPAAQIRLSLKKDHTGFTLGLGSMAAKIGPGSGEGELHKGCDLILDHDIPSSHTFALKPVTYTVRGQLRTGTTATLWVRTFFTGDQGIPTRTEKLSGPFTGLRQLPPADTELRYNPCGEDRLIRIQTNLLVDAPDKSRRNFLELPNDDLYEFAWKECPDPRRSS
ncbi:uncharacterized protein DUF4360 [Actinomadura pelletieri DSM 43383]|uniref:Uncharacterized protein DUF4360 n=1 Tax=Actinomadura pelletieri DSM 43383 TaxID=1120940 RepID=A0A495R007_9ACTN|nr:DUF4360 domain-containing protein [Actinomadura pelletieri]RKS79815.1 uncharacterized protein DUF4360 [Actinomadura pelletieri DSM 43383]